MDELYSSLEAPHILLGAGHIADLSVVRALASGLAEGYDVLVPVLRTRVRHSAAEEEHGIFEAHGTKYTVGGAYLYDLESWCTAGNENCPRPLCDRLLQYEICSSYVHTGKYQYNSMNLP